MSFDFKSIIRTAAIAAAFLCATQPAAEAQGKGPAGTNPNEFKVLKVSDLKRECRQKPRSITGASAKSKEWGVFDATFATAPEWIDGLMVTFTVVLDNPKVKDIKSGEPKLTLLQTTLEYPYIAKGNDHRVGVVVPPGVMGRFGDPVGFAVQFSIDGQEIASQGVFDGMLKTVGDGWWANPRVLEAPFLQKLDGYLVDRMKSPFLLVDIDSYEVSR